MRTLFLAAAWFAMASCATAGEKSTYLLVERTDRLRVLDRYQQELSPSDRASLPPFMPFRIVARHDLLGDGFTPCMTVEAEGIRYFLLVERPGILPAVAGVQREFADAISLDDTVRIRTPYPLLSPLGAAGGTIGRGDLFVRDFRRGDETYGHMISRPGRFWWVRLPAVESPRTWEIVRTSSSGGTGMTPRIVDEVKNRIKETNDVTARLYAAFNAGGKYRRTPPRWEVLLHSGGMECVLRDPPNTDVTESTDALTQLCVTALLGSGMQVSSSPGSIVIRRP